MLLRLNEVKCSTLYFASKVVCFCDAKRKTNENSLVFYNVKKIPKSDAL